MSEQHYNIIDIDDPQKDGLYRDIDSVAKFAWPHFVEKEGPVIKFRPVRRSDAIEPEAPPWDDCNTQAADIRATVGTPHNVLAGIATADFTNDTAGVITVISRQTGTATKRNVQRIHIDNHVVPTDGNIIINFNRPEIVNVTAKNNKGTAQVFQAEFTTADVAGDHHLTYDDWADASGPVRVYFDNGTGGGPPAVPAGGRLLQVIYVNNDTAATLAAKVKAKLILDAVFSPVYAAASVVKLIVTDTAKGPRTFPFQSSVAPTGITYGAITPGAAGPLTGKTFKLFDQNGSIGVWFQVGGAAIPVAAADCNRSIAVTVTDNDTNAAVATAIATAVDADAEFTATVSGTTLVVITDVIGGARENAIDIDSTLAVGVTQNGKGMTYNGPYGKHGAMALAFENYFQVILRKNNDIDFKAIDVGPNPAITLDITDLEYPNVIVGQLPLNTAEMAAYFAAQMILKPDLEYVLLTFELKLKFAGQDWVTVYRVGQRVYLTIFDAGVLPTTLGGAAGKTAIANGAFQVAVVFAVPLATAAWHFAGLPTISNTVDVGAGNITCGTLTARSNLGFTIQLQGATDTANYKLEWVVIPD